MSRKFIIPNRSARYFSMPASFFCSVSRTRVRGLKVPRPRVRAFTSIALLFFFVGLQILARGLIGEYVGRIYMVVRRRPKYVTKEILE
jgi:hypothetical protein